MFLMDNGMAKATDRNNIKPVFWCVIPVMVLFCLIIAFDTLEGGGMRQFPPSNTIINGGSRLERGWVLSVILCGSEGPSFSYFQPGFILFAAFLALRCCFVFAISFASFFRTPSGFNFGSLVVSLQIFFVVNSTFRQSTSGLFAFFADRNVIAIPCLVPVEVSNWFSFFALRTTLRYDCLRHGRFLLKNGCAGAGCDSYHIRLRLLYQGRGG